MASSPLQGDEMIRRIARFWFALAAASLLAPAAPAAPAEATQAVSARDSKAIRAVVEAQLAAFAADDAKQAFAYAAPSIREMFGTPERFIEMVKAGYPVVYRPASVTFLPPLRVQGQVLIGLRLADADGAQWLATYSLEQQPDKSWRISGCDVQPAAGRAT